MILEKIKEFEAEIQKIDSRLIIVYRPEFEADVAPIGISGFPHSICSLRIKEDEIISNLEIVKEIISGELEKLKDPEYHALATMTDEEFDKSLKNSQV